MAEYPVRLFLDTSIYIPFINHGIAHPAIEFPQGQPLIYMNSVVMEELYAGALDIPSIKLLDKMYDTFSSMNRLITPDAADWQKTGKVIAQLGRKYGFEEIYLSRITNDVLLAASARKIGGAIVTNNLKDFQRIQEYIDFKIYKG
jgi:predicted nucleic acid-binding protein